MNWLDMYTVMVLNTTMRHTGIIKVQEYVNLMLEKVDLHCIDVIQQIQIKCMKLIMQHLIVQGHQ